MLPGREASAKTLTAYSANTSLRQPTCLGFPKNSSIRSHGNSIPDRERHSAGKLLRNCSSQKALSILPTTGQTSVRAPVQPAFPRGPLKSGKQTALPTFQPPLLLECYKSIQTDFVAFGVCTRPCPDCGGPLSTLATAGCASRFPWDRTGCERTSGIDSKGHDK